MACKNGLYRQSYSICPIKYQIQIFSFQEDDQWLNSLLGPHFEHAVALKFSLCLTESVRLSTIFVNNKSPKV